VRDQGKPPQYAERQVERARVKVKTEFVTDKNGRPYGDNQDNVRMGLAKLDIEVRYDSFSDVMVVTGLDGFDKLDDAALDRIWLKLDKEHRFRRKNSCGLSSKTTREKTRSTPCATTWTVSNGTAARGSTSGS
jgi:hypothetical protein